MAKGSVTVFHKGMNKDTHPTAIQQGEYIEAWNSVLLSSVNGNLFNIANEAGFVDAVTNPEDFTRRIIIGLYPLDGDIIVFSIVFKCDIGFVSGGVFDAQTGEILNIINAPDNFDISSEVGVLERNINTRQNNNTSNETFTYRVIVNDKNDIYWRNGNIDIDELWNFQITHQIEATARIGFDNKRTVYWTDGLNPPRVLNLDVDYTDNENLRTFVRLDNETRLFEAFERPYIRYNQMLAGGSIKPGVYQFAARYLNQTLDTTTFGFICHPIPVLSTNRADGGRASFEGGPWDSPVISKAIELTVHNVDRSYELIELAVIYYEGAGSIPKIRIFDRRNITSSIFTVVFDGNFLNEQELTLADLVRTPTIYNTAKHIIQKDGHLFLSNLTQNNNRDLQELANNITIRYIARDIPLAEGNEFFEDYKEENNTFDWKGYRRDEVYSFGIVGIFEDGTETLVHHIPGEVNVPVNTPDSGSGVLIPYESEAEYIGAPYVDRDYYRKNGVNLSGQGIRHHRFPNFTNEPFYYEDALGNKWLRILGVQLEGISNYLGQPANEKLRLDLRQLLLVRQVRNTIENKSVYTQGTIHSLMKFQGRDRQKPIRFGFQAGVGDTPYPQSDRVLDIFMGAVFAPLEEFIDVLSRLTDARLNSKLSPSRILPTYSIDPFFNNTSIEEVNSAMLISGVNVPSDANDYGAFFSPEVVFQQDFFLPNNAITRTVYAVEGNPTRIVNGRKPEFIQFNNGHYYHRPEAPYNGLFKAPYHHLFTEFLNNPTIFPVLDTPLRSNVKTKWNDMVTSNGNILSLNVRIGENGGSAVNREIKLNCFETEPFLLLRSQGNVPIQRIVFGVEIRIRVGGLFKAIFVPILPVTLGQDMTTLSEALDFETLFGNSGPMTFTGFTVVQLVAYILQILMFGGSITTATRIDSTDFLTLLNPIDNPQAGDNDFFVDGASVLSNENVELGEALNIIYNLIVPNNRQYGLLDNSEYILVDTLFSNKSIQQAREEIFPNPDDLTNVILVEDNQLKPFDRTNITPALFNGDTFINKFYYKTGTNIPYKMINLEQTASNRYALEKQNTAGVFSSACPLIFGSVGAFTNLFQVNRDGNHIMTGQQSYKTIDVRVADTIAPFRDGINLRHGVLIWLESSINTDYRHRPISYTETTPRAGDRDQFSVTPNYDNAQLGVPYYPRDPIELCLEVTPEYGHSTGYNFQYSFENTLKKYFGPKYGQVFVNDFPTRTIYSESIDSVVDFGKPVKSELSDRWRRFLPLNYQDLPKHKGEITNQFENNGGLYLHTERSLFKVFVNPTTVVPSSTFELFLGNNSVFRNAPQELYQEDGGYVGCINKYSGVNTPYGYMFYDHYSRKLFLFTQSIEEVSRAGMYSFFLEKLNYDNNLNQLKTEEDIALSYNPNYLNNPANPFARGVNAFYDPINTRYVIGFKLEESFGTAQFDINLPNVPCCNFIYRLFETNDNVLQPFRFGARSRVRHDIPQFPVVELPNVFYRDGRHRAGKYITDNCDHIPFTPFRSTEVVGGVRDAQLTEAGVYRVRVVIYWGNSNDPLNRPLRIDFLGSIIAVRLNTRNTPNPELLARVSLRFYLHLFGEEIDIYNEAIDTTNIPIDDFVNWTINMPLPQGVTRHDTPQIIEVERTLTQAQINAGNNFLYLGHEFDTYVNPVIVGVVGRNSSLAAQVFLDTNDAEGNELSNVVQPLGDTRIEVSRLDCGGADISLCDEVQGGEGGVDPNQLVNLTLGDPRYITLSYNLLTKQFVSFHNYFPAISTTSDSNVYSSNNDYLNREIVNNQVIHHLLHLHNVPNYSNVSNRGISGRYGVYYNRVGTAPFPFIIRLCVNEDPMQNKVFDNFAVILEINNEAVEAGIISIRDFFDTVQCFTDQQSCNPQPITIYPFAGDELTTNCKFYNNQYQLYVPFVQSTDQAGANNQIRDRITPNDVFNPIFRGGFENRPRFRGKYLIVEFVYDNMQNDGVPIVPAVDYVNPRKRNFNLSLQAVITKFRNSIR